MREKIFIIDGGDTFEGNLKQFKDCFFDNADEVTIKNWCKENGFKLKIEEREKTVNTNEEINEAILAGHIIKHREKGHASFYYFLFRKTCWVIERFGKKRHSFARTTDINKDTKWRVNCPGEIYEVLDKKDSKTKQLFKEMTDYLVERLDNPRSRVSFAKTLGFAK